MDPKKKPQWVKNCPICRVAMVGERTNSQLEEFNIYRCLDCGSTITSTPRAGRNGNE